MWRIPRLQDSINRRYDSQFNSCDANRQSDNRAVRAYLSCLNEVYIQRGLRSRQPSILFCLTYLNTLSKFINPLFCFINQKYMAWAYITIEGSTSLLPCWFCVNEFSMATKRLRSQFTFLHSHKSTHCLLPVDASRNGWDRHVTISAIVIKVPYYFAHLIRINLLFHRQRCIRLTTSIPCRSPRYSRFFVSLCGFVSLRDRHWACLHWAMLKKPTHFSWTNELCIDFKWLYAV